MTLISKPEWEKIGQCLHAIWLRVPEATKKCPEYIQTLAAITSGRDELRYKVQDELRARRVSIGSSDHLHILWEVVGRYMGWRM